MPYPKYPLLKKCKKSSLSLDKYPNEKSNKKKNFKPFSDGMDVKSLFNTFSDNENDASSLKKIVEKTKFTRKLGKPIVFCFERDILKQDMAPLIIDLMERGWISAISVSLSFAITDFEISLSGKFIDYNEQIFSKSKVSGVAEETGLFFNFALKESAEKEIGAGEAIGSYIGHSKFDFRNQSVIYSAYKLNIPVTIRSSVGTEPIFFHSGFDGRTFGHLLEKDFILFSSIISKIKGGGMIFSFSTDLNIIKVISNSILFCRISNPKIKGITLSIINIDFSKRLYKAIENLKKTENIDVLEINSETKIILSFIAAMIR